MVSTLPSRNKAIGFLFITILSAFVIRATTIWWTRPDFVGWFNHSYYYWLQTRSILTDGTLAYPDMPLLLWLYSALTWLLQPFISQDLAIIHSARFFMSLIPVLLPIIFYRMLIDIKPDAMEQLSAKLLLLSSAILPLSIVHMPEILQKNMLGIVLLLGCLYTIHGWLKHGSAKWLITIAIVISLVSLTHLGSALACLLLLIALYLVTIFYATNRRLFLNYSLLIALGILLIFSYLYVFNPRVHSRVQLLLSEIMSISVVEMGLTLIAFVVMAVIVKLLFRRLDNHARNIPTSLSLLSKVCLIWLLMLLAPIWPGEMASRLLLFLPLAVLIILYAMSFIPQRFNVSRLLIGLWTTACTAMMIGEIVSLNLTERNKELVYRELLQMNNQYQLTDRDLIISPYATHTLTSWLFRTKGSMITAVEEDTFRQYERVFVLNTLQRPAPRLAHGEERLLTTEYQAYQASRHDIPLPYGLGAEPNYTHFSLFQLDTVPENWIFNDQRKWSGWRSTLPE